MGRAPATKTNPVRAVDRAIAILKAFTLEKSSMSVLEIEKLVNLNRPTVYRLLATLASHGLIRAYGAPQRFSLDYGVGELSQNWLAGLDPVAAGRPIVERLHQETRESVDLMLVRGHQHFCVLELPSPHVLSMARGIGPMGNLWRGASGKAILAFMNESDIDAVFRGLPRNVDKNVLLRELASIRKDKYKVSRSEIFQGAVGVAAPYFDHTNAVAGSLIVFGPEVRLSEKRVLGITRVVVESAAELSAALGQRPRSRERT
jgi:IclR family transcriptional regulator, acetate operon repressor